jgi:hypothetical protein
MMKEGNNICYGSQKEVQGQRATARVLLCIQDTVHLDVNQLMKKDYKKFFSFFMAAAAWCLVRPLPLGPRPGGPVV